jgi:hypothetical protein
MCLNHPAGLILFPAVASISLLIQRTHRVVGDDLGRRGGRARGEGDEEAKKRKHSCFPALCVPGHVNVSVNEAIDAAAPARVNGRRKERRRNPRTLENEDYERSGKMMLRDSSRRYDTIRSLSETSKIETLVATVRTASRRTTVHDSINPRPLGGALLLFQRVGAQIRARERHRLWGGVLTSGE